jgi:hypothetical protein
MGVVIEIFVKYPGGPTRMTVTDIQVPSTGTLQRSNSNGTPGDFVVASGSSLVPPRAAADTRGQYSTLHYTGGSIVRYAMQGQQRGAQERRREGGNGGQGKRGRSDCWW